MVNGSGKTLIMTALMREALLKGESVFYGFYSNEMCRTATSANINLTEQDMTPVQDDALQQYKQVKQMVLNGSGIDESRGKQLICQTVVRLSEFSRLIESMRDKFFEQNPDTTVFSLMLAIDEFNTHDRRTQGLQW